METGSFIYENFPYDIIIWLHFGTNTLITYGYLFYVVPIVYNIVVMVMPHFNFGFMRAKGGGTGSGETVIPADLNETLKDSKIFAHAYSRNPKLFSSLSVQETSTFFSNLDEKLTSISSALSEFPVAEEKKDAQAPSNEVSMDDHTSVTVANSGKHESNQTEKSEGLTAEDNDKKTKKSKKKKDGQESKSKIKGFLLYGNLVFLIAILGINGYGYFQYSSLFKEYFVLKKSIFKYAEESYNLDYQKLRSLKDKKKAKTLLEINEFVQIINSVKGDKLRREKLKELEEQEKNKK